MIDATIERQLHQEMVRLTPEQQHQVLHYARSLPYDGPLGVPGTALLGLIGIIPPEDLQAMADAIEEHCERVNLDEWE